MYRRYKTSKIKMHTRIQVLCMKSNIILLTTSAFKSVLFSATLKSLKNINGVSFKQYSCDLNVWQMFILYSLRIIMFWSFETIDCLLISIHSVNVLFILRIDVKNIFPTTDIFLQDSIKYKLLPEATRESTFKPHYKYPRLLWREDPEVEFYILAMYVWNGKFICDQDKFRVEFWLEVYVGQPYHIIVYILRRAGDS